MTGQEFIKWFEKRQSVETNWSEYRLGQQSKSVSESAECR